MPWRWLRIVLLAPIVLAVLSELSSGEPVTRTVRQYRDVTGDGRLDEIVLRVTGQGADQPYTWTLRIRSAGRTVLRYQRDDTAIDALFHGEDDVLGCQGYRACKAQYYFHDILASLVVPPSGYALDGLLDASADNTLYPVGRRSLRTCCGIRGVKATRILTNMARRLRGGQAIVIAIRRSPLTTEPPMVYAPEVRRFVPIYEE
jgi:hypothetical protein